MEATEQLKHKREETTNEIVTARPTRSKYNILYVDDEPHNLRVFKSSFRRYYNVYTAESAYDAIELLKQHHMHLVVTDQKMPGMTGTQFLEQIRPDYPDAISIIITGFSDIDDITDAINKCGIYSYITKPWDARDVKLTLEKALEIYNLRNEKESLIQDLFDATVNLEEKVDERTEELKQANERVYDSINYALTIQRAILPQKRELDKYFTDSFVYYRAQDVVSGDYYFFSKVEKKVVIGAFDCTGHGVPGALLSILGFSALENIVQEKGITDGAEILTQLNEKVHHQLSKRKESNESDGMDGSIIIVDEEANKIELFSANGEIIYYQDGERKSYKGDRYSIGTQPEIDAPEGDRISLSDTSEIYLFSDGFKDQLNEAHVKRYSSNRFRELLDYTHSLSMQEQQEILEKELKQWKGNETELNDDIMVIGIRI